MPSATSPDNTGPKLSMCFLRNARAAAISADVGGSEIVERSAKPGLGWTEPIWPWGVGSKLNLRRLMSAIIDAVAAERPFFGDGERAQAGGREHLIHRCYGLIGPASIRSPRVASEAGGAETPRPVRDQVPDVVARKRRDCVPGLVLLRVVAALNERVADGPLGLEDFLCTLLASTAEKDVVVGHVVPVVGVVTEPVPSCRDVEDDAPVVILHDALTDQVERGARASDVKCVKDCARVSCAVRSIVVGQLN